MLNETHVNDLLCAALSKMARNEQLAVDLTFNHGRKTKTWSSKKSSFCDSNI